MHAIALDFASKKEWAVTLDGLSATPAAGTFFWVILDPSERSQGLEVLARLGANPEASAALIGPQLEGRYDVYDNALHFSVTEAWYEAGMLKSGITEVLLGGHFMVVMLSGPSPVMEQIKRVYREDFSKFAKSSGFLLYEMASRLLDAYRKTFQQFALEVERIQLTLFGDVTDDIFLGVSRLTADILAFRRMVLASRDLLTQLATRKSAFVSETTQPMLGIHAERMEKLGDELESERNVLSETLNLYMGMVGHRTNRIVNRLTIFSMIFLPLSFICGVYGMNLKGMPEAEWPHSYKVFWLAVAVFVAGFMVFIRKRKWI